MLSRIQFPVYSHLIMAFPLRRNPSFRAEHVASLLRPDYLMEVRHV